MGLEDWVEPLLQRGDLEQALKIARRHSNSYPDDFSGHYYAGNILCTMGRFEASIQYLERARELKPENQVVWTLLGDAYLALATNFKERRELFIAHEYLEKAVASYRSALDIDPKNPHPHALLGFGHIFRFLGDLEGARHYFRATFLSAKEKEDELLGQDALLELSVTLRDMGRMVIAKENFEIFVQLYPHDYRGRVELGTLYVDLWKRKHARRFKQKACEQFRYVQEHLWEFTDPAYQYRVQEGMQELDRVECNVVDSEELEDLLIIDPDIMEALEQEKKKEVVH
ncbi:tetratricopeptide repeat protein [Candidatus Woesearchaeota archaeon]|nr:tetratricopeptide repeat protein [Candidatus Woesearchaeota archaeon]